MRRSKTAGSPLSRRALRDNWSNLAANVLSGPAGAVALALLAVAVTGAYAQSRPQADVAETNVMLCDSPEHAIAYTVAVNDGAPDDMAKNIVGKAAGAEVCDKFIGHASVEEQKTLWDKGLPYVVTSFKFKGVGAMRWSAIPKDQE